MIKIFVAPKPFKKSQTNFAWTTEGEILYIGSGSPGMLFGTTSFKGTTCAVVTEKPLTIKAYAELISKAYQHAWRVPASEVNAKALKQARALIKLASKYEPNTTVKF